MKPAAYFSFYRAAQPNDVNLVAVQNDELVQTHFVAATNELSADVMYFTSGRIGRA